MKELTVALGERAYPIRIGQDVLDGLPDILRHIDARGAVAICTDTNVAPLYAPQVVDWVASAGLKPVLCVMPAGEEHKRLERIETLCGQFLDGGLDRASAVVAVGGGVVGDVAGFAASVFMRGIPHIQIPTTVVAQVDSSVGGKTAVNHPLGKNIIGTFHQPSAVLIDISLLHTLPERELRAGLAEVIKHGMIADRDLFAYMEKSAAPILSKALDALEYPIRRSCEIKAAVVAADEREQGLRAHLNYGHTFGHGIEAASHYTRFLHGEAVALGMHAAALLAQRLGLVDGELVERQRACLTAYGLPVSWHDLPVREAMIAMKRDKKARRGILKFIVPMAVGEVVARNDVVESEAEQALQALRIG